MSRLPSPRLSLRPLRRALLPLLLVAGCRFGSVSPVSESIAATAQHSEAVSLGESLCRLGTAMVSDAPDCDDRAAAIDRLVLAVGELSSYGARLSRLAGIDSVDLGVAPGAVISLGETLGGGTLAGIERKGIETASQIITDVITTSVKRRALRKAVVTTDRSVQCLAWRSVEATEVWRRELARIAEARAKADALDIVLAPAAPRAPEADVDDEVPTETPTVASTQEQSRSQPDPIEPRVVALEEAVGELEEDTGRTTRRALESQRLALRSVQVIAAEHDRRLAALERGLWAVALSHHHLACNAERLGTTRDRGLRSEIDRRVACVLERERPPQERSAACRPVLAQAEAMRAAACQDLLRDGDDGKPEPVAPACDDTEGTSP